MRKLDRIIENFKSKGGSLIGLLQDTSEELGYLPVKALEEISEKLNVPE